LLPSSSSQENLETISRNKFNLLFEPQLFEIRPEEKRDKGIDFTIEIKENRLYTNFRFAIQLKSTDTIPLNKDNSISFPVEVNNINYLLNYGMPAYYILYEHKENKFYLEHVNHVYSLLIKKYNNKKLPKEFKVRFSKQLTPQLIHEIYSQTLENGMLLRRLSPHLKYSFPEPKQVKGIVIDEDNEVYSVEQNVAFINQYGFLLLNQAAFKRIVEIEQRTHPRTSASATFNLVCGLAYFHRANLFKALELLKLAQKESKEFSAEAQSMLAYTLLNAKFLLGMIDESNFKKDIAQLMDSDNLGSFLELEKAYKTFLKSNQKDKERINLFYKTTEQIIAKNIKNNRARIMAYANLLQAESRILVTDLSENLMLICGKVNDFKQTKTYKKWINLETQYKKRMDALFDYAFKEKDYLSLSNIALDRVHWNYAKIFLNHIFNNWNKNSFSVEGSLNETDKEKLLKDVSYLDRIIKGYEVLEHTENVVACLSLKYELLHLAGCIEDAAITSEKIITIIEANDFNGLKGRHDRLLNGGTGYERFVKSFTDHMNDMRTLVNSCGLGEYLNQDIPKSMLSFIERDVKWSIDKFFKFYFPESVLIN
jgi:hypothetical protein